MNKHIISQYSGRVPLLVAFLKIQRFRMKSKDLKAGMYYRLRSDASVVDYSILEIHGQLSHSSYSHDPIIAKACEYYPDWKYPPIDKVMHEWYAWDIMGYNQCYKFNGKVKAFFDLLETATPDELKLLTSTPYSD